MAENNRVVVTPSDINICECGCIIQKGFDKIHRETKKHETYLLFKDIIVNDKIFCEKCNIIMPAAYYPRHLMLSSHINGVEKVFCECGSQITRSSMRTHLAGDRHKRAIDKKNNIKLERKIAIYEENKNDFNCCSVCYKIKIFDQYYIPKLN